MKSLCSLLLLSLSFILLINLRISNSQQISVNKLSEKLPFYEGNYPSFNQYTGYFTTTEKYTRNLFYWFIESETEPSKKPVLLWLNGGPGCSSLKGLFMGNGPFSPNPKNGGKTIINNPNSWTKFANIIFLENPVGVGFSHSSNLSEDLKLNGDVRHASDAWMFLKKFFENPQFSSFKSNDLYISGQSYGGHYVPILSKKILEENNNKNSSLNFKGFIIGNPLIDFKLNVEAALDFYYATGISSPNSIDSTKSICEITTDPTGWFNKALGDQQKKCIGSIMGVMQGIQNTIDNYAIYDDKCILNNNYYYTKSCTPNHIGAYLNKDEVKKVLKVTSGNKIWSHCDGLVYENYNKMDEYGSSKQVLDYLFTENNKTGNNLKYLIYTGDTDSNTNYLTAIKVFKDMKWKLINDMTPWFLNQQVGGRQFKYESFTYSTVRAAGHLAPHTQPLRTYHLVSNFIENGTIPANATMKTSNGYYNYQRFNYYYLFTILISLLFIFGF